MRRSPLPSALVLLAACLRTPVAPEAPVPATSSPSGASAAVTFVADPERDGLTVELYDAKPADGAAERLPTPPTTPLSDAEIGKLIARLPPLATEADDVLAFALRKGPTPPPRAGATELLDLSTSDAAAPTPDAGPLTVLRKAPEGAVPLAPHLSVTFSRPMVALTDADTAAKTVPVELVPAPAGEWRWLGTKTAIFQPDGRFPMATRYTATIPAGTKAADGTALGAATSWTFETPPISLRASAPSDDQPQPLSPPIYLAFDQAVDAAALLPSLSLKGAGRAVPLRIAEGDEVPAHLRKREQPERSVVLLPAEPLQNATLYTMTVGRGAPSAEGPVPTATEQSFSFRTYGALTVAAPTCWQSPCPPDAGWYLEFSNPLDEERFDAAAITVEPAVAGLSVIPSANGVSLYGAFAPRTTYTVRVAAGIADVFGQTLPKAESFRMDVGPADRSFRGPDQPFVVLDPSGPPALSIFTTNQPTLQVEIRRVTPERWSEWTAWWEKYRWEDAKKGPLPGERVFGGSVRVASEPDRQVETKIDLSPYLKGGSGQFVVYVQPGTQPKDRWARQEWLGWVQVTKLGLTALREDAAVTAWVTDLADGKAGADVEVTLLGPDAKPARTDREGLARLPLEAAEGLVARRGDDVALLPASPWGYESSWLRVERMDQLRWFVFDDKHLYKPNETVHVRGWLREQAPTPDGKLAPPRGREVRWVARSSLGNPLGEGTAKISGLGGFSFDLKLPATPDLGTATIELQTDGEWSSHAFEIQEYRTPEFEVVAAGADEVYTLGEDAVVDVAARYYAGGGLPAAPVRWAVTSSPGTFVPPGREEWSFGPWSPWWKWWDEPETYVPPTTLDGVTDATGAHHLGIHFAALRPARPMTVRAEATVTDVNRQAWTASREFLVHPSAWYVGLKTARPYVEAKAPIEVEAVVVDRAGTAVDAPAQVRLDRLQWKRVAGQWKEVPETIDTRTVTGTGKVSFSAPAGGSYALVATVTDAEGRANETEIRLWVAGAQLTPDRGVEQERVTLAPEKKSWSVGETARIVVQAPFAPAEGLLTVRAGGTLLETRRFAMTDAVLPIDVAITEAHVPDFTVAVDLVGARTRTDDAGAPRAELPKRVAYAGGTVTLDVSRKTRALTVAVKPVEARLSPGGKTEIALAVTGPDGAPVRDAELAVVAVDEAVLALTGYQLPEPLAVFYGPRGDGVATDHLRQWVQLVDPAALPSLQGGLLGGATGAPGLGASGFGRGGGGMAEGAEAMDMAPPPAAMAAAPMSEEAAPRRSRAESKSAPAEPEPDAAAPIALRSDFSAVALWAPAVRTDAAGKAVVPLALPDSLTRYRVMVVAVTQEQFGSGTADVTARLPLMVRPSAPRFLNFGDRAELPVVLQNQTDAPLVVDLALRTANLGVLATREAALTSGTDRAGRRVTVPANDRVEVRFPVAAADAGTARFQLAAASGAYADAAAGELPVWTPATTEAFATYGTFDQDGAIGQPLVPPADVWPQYGGLEVTLSSTQLQSLTDAVVYLQTYPYECNEQLASRVLSVAALRDVLGAFRAEGLPSPEAIDATMLADLERLARRQNGDGGWAFWRKGDESWPYLSVHVAHALVRARAAKLPVDEGSLARALEHARRIEAYIPHWYSPEAKRAIRAYAVHVLSLAGEPAPAKARALFAEAGADGLGVQGVGWILPTLVEAKATKEVATLRQWLGNRVTESAAGAHFATGYRDGEHVLLTSDRVADGVVLEALIRTQPKDELVPKLVNGLLAHRTAGRWASTTENAHILLAMDRYFKVYEGVTPDFVARVWLGDGLAGEKTFRGRTTERAQVEVPMAWLQEAGKTEIVLGKQGAGRVYYRLGLRYAPTDLDAPPADRGFEVSRRYEAVDDPADVRRGDDGVWWIKAGARVRVRVEMVTPMRRYHVALVDPLPAGLEVLNPDLAVTGTVPADPSAQPAYWWWSRPWYDHENLRDERVEAFASLLWEGVHTYTYVARATTPGDFVVPPAKAEEMYSPETFGRSGGDRVIVE